MIKRLDKKELSALRKEVSAEIKEIKRDIKAEEKADEFSRKVDRLYDRLEGNELLLDAIDNAISNISSRLDDKDWEAVIDDFKNAVEFADNNKASFLSRDVLDRVLISDANENKKECDMIRRIRSESQKRRFNNRLNNRSLVCEHNEALSPEELDMLETVVNAAANRVSLRRDIPYLRVKDIEGENLGSARDAYIAFDMYLFVKEKGTQEASIMPIRIHVEFSPCEGYSDDYYTMDSGGKEFDSRLKQRLAYHNENYRSDACKIDDVSYLIGDNIDEDIREIMYLALDYGMEHDWFDRYAKREFVYVDKPNWW